MHRAGGEPRWHKTLNSDGRSVNDCQPQTRTLNWWRSLGGKAEHDGVGGESTQRPKKRESGSHRAPGNRRGQGRLQGGSSTEAGRSQGVSAVGEGTGSGQNAEQEHRGAR